MNKRICTPSYAGDILAFLLSDDKHSRYENIWLQQAQLTAYKEGRHDQSMKAHTDYLIALHAHAAAWKLVAPAR
ncbi:hypothetical protein HZU75_07345 [Chitinibacter fontanus]|uniref:Uncharacterized protein n=1 Tax=Chitinibacter fontanus TaxID=1737446 RepID=A0A7D5V9K7_9NEIS|nr:hypothetical protein [Chitinibacter fontanus]QLI81354.1 hypothetical protein HZU75_07345 [Chitinibacter fontanus]